MSYSYLTQFDSPNYTPASQTRSVWGRDRQIQEIVIHWWGDPSTNPSFEGVVNYLCRANGNSSAHFVATGTDRRVACIVAPADNAWASNNDNPISIAIECDPRCRDEDYDVVAELVAELRATYGNLPLKRHGQIVQTTCPGNWDLARIDREAANKVANPQDQFGLAHSKVGTRKNASADEVRQAYLDILERNADPAGINHYTQYPLEFVRSDLAHSQEKSVLENRKAAEAKAKVDALAKAEADRIAADKAAQDKALADAKAAEDAKNNVPSPEPTENPTKNPSEPEKGTSTQVESPKQFLSRLWEALVKFWRS